jgi:hypothetical protein
MKNDVDNMKSEKYLLEKSHASFMNGKKFYNVDQRISSSCFHIVSFTHTLA